MDLSLFQFSLEDWNGSDFYIQIWSISQYFVDVLWDLFIFPIVVNLWWTVLDRKTRCNLEWEKEEQINSQCWCRVALEFISTLELGDKIHRTHQQCSEESVGGVASCITVSTGLKATGLSNDYIHCVRKYEASNYWGGSRENDGKSCLLGRSGDDCILWLQVWEKQMYMLDSILFFSLRDLSLRILLSPSHTIDSTGTVPCTGLWWWAC
jgi:hypothetical protein